MERGFPRLETVRSALTALYRHFHAPPPDGRPAAGSGRPGPSCPADSTASTPLDAYANSVLPVEVAFEDTEDPRLGAERLARAMVRQLRLPEARVSVTFRAMADAAAVELTAGPEYAVELNSRFLRHRRDIGAALAHEVTHVWLHRNGLEWPETADNEILTDTAACFLGAGWLLLDAFRQDAVSSQKLGYLTPEEFGYVLAKRARVFGEDPAIWFTSPQAYEAYVRGRTRAERDATRPPLAASGRGGRRWRYARERARAQRVGHGSGPGYTFVAGSPLRVAFPCPTCYQRIRVPVRGPVRVRCALCRAVLDCDT
ncbi:hypothetical protein E0L36_05625 [Streptomyces sp. AJS327]|nr:hypothetical protein [Streptomyces sp. AJS327]